MGRFISSSVLWCRVLALGLTVGSLALGVVAVEAERPTVRSVLASGAFSLSPGGIATIYVTHVGTLITGNSRPVAGEIRILDIDGHDAVAPTHFVVNARETFALNLNFHQVGPPHSTGPVLVRIVVRQTSTGRAGRPSLELLADGDVRNPQVPRGDLKTDRCVEHLPFSDVDCTEGAGSSGANGPAVTAGFVSHVLALDPQQDLNIHVANVAASTGGPVSGHVQFWDLSGGEVVPPVDFTVHPGKTVSLAPQLPVQVPIRVVFVPASGPVGKPATLGPVVPSLEVCLQFDPPSCGAIAPPRNVKADASEARTDR